MQLETLQSYESTAWWADSSNILLLFHYPTAVRKRLKRLEYFARFVQTTFNICVNSTSSNRLRSVSNSVVKFFTLRSGVKLCLSAAMCSLKTAHSKHIFYTNLQTFMFRKCWKWLFKENQWNYPHIMFSKNDKNA